MSVALVVGLGSIGSRHQQVLNRAGHDVLTVSRREIGDYASVEDALSDRPDIDYVVLATATHDHLEGLATLDDLGYSGRVLVEKPLAHRLLRDGENHDRGVLDVWVGYNLRHHGCLGFLRNWLEGRRPISVQVRAGQHLGQWRPGRELASTASAIPQSGGVLRDLSHELDYLLWIFGDWRRVASVGGSLSSLPIESDDVFLAMIEFESGTLCSLELNYLDASATRSIVVTTDSGTASLDLIAGTVEVDGRTETFVTDRDATYALLHEELTGPDAVTVTCSMAEGLEIVGLIDSIERSSTSQEWMTR